MALNLKQIYFVVSKKLHEMKFGDLSRLHLNTTVKQKIFTKNENQCFFKIKDSYQNLNSLSITYIDRLINNRDFLHWRLLVVFHTSLSDSKSPQVYKTLLIILAVFNNAMACIVSIFSSDSQFIQLFKSLGIVSSALTTILIILTVMFHSFSAL